MNPNRLKLLPGDELTVDISTELDLPRTLPTNPKVMISGVKTAHMYCDFSLSNGHTKGSLVTEGVPVKVPFNAEIIRFRPHANAIIEDGFNIAFC